MAGRKQRVTFVSFGFRADDLDPAEITAAIGVSPTRSFRRGDVFISVGIERRRPWGVWVLETRRSSNNIDDHLEDLLLDLEPRKDVIRRINDRAGFHTLLKIWWIQTDITIGLSINGQLLSRASALVESVGVTIREDDSSDGNNPDLAK
jgi:hypothetical protein